MSIELYTIHTYTYEQLCETQKMLHKKKLWLFNPNVLLKAPNRHPISWDLIPLCSSIHVKEE